MDVDLDAGERDSAGNKTSTIQVDAEDRGAGLLLLKRLTSVPYPSICMERSEERGRRQREHGLALRRPTHADQPQVATEEACVLQESERSGPDLGTS